MLDLIQAQEALKNAPDARLVQEMQQPSGNLPAFLVLGEMQRRQKMRQEAQAQQAQQQAGGTVAQDLTQQTGLAALAQMQPQMQQPAMQQQMPQQQMAPQMQQRPAGLPAMMARGGAVRTDPNEALRAASDYVASISSSQSGFLENPGFIDDIARQHGVNPDALRVRLGMSGGRQMPMEMYRGGAVYMSEGGDVNVTPQFAPPNNDQRMLFGRPLSEYSQGELERILYGSGPLRGFELLRERLRPETTRLSPDLRNMIEGRIDELQPTAPARSDDNRMAEIVGRGIGSRRVVDQMNERLRERGEAPIQEPYYDPFTRSSRVSPIPEMDPVVDPTQGEEIPPPPPPAPPVPGARLVAPSGSSSTAAAARTGTSSTAAPAAVSQDPPAQQQPAQPDRFEALLERMIASRGNPEARQAQQRDMALLQLGLGLMGSRSPTFGGALGEAGMPALASYAAAQRNAEREDRQSLEDQISLERYRNERDYRNAETQRREAADNRRFDLEERRLRLEAGRGDRDPVANQQRLLEFYRGLSPEDRALFDRLQDRGAGERNFETQLRTALTQDPIIRSLVETRRTFAMGTTPEAQARVRQIDEDIARRETAIRNSLRVSPTAPTPEASSGSSGSLVRGQDGSLSYQPGGR